VCTPLGFVRLFGVVGQFLVKPQFLHDLDEEFFVARLEEDCVRRRLFQATATGKSYVSPAPMCPLPISLGCDDDDDDDDDDVTENTPDGLMTLQNGALQSGLGERLLEIQFRRKVLGNCVTYLCRGERRTLWRQPALSLSLLFPPEIFYLNIVNQVVEIFYSFNAKSVCLFHF